MIANDYAGMCKALLENVRFSDPSPVGSPEGSPFDAGALANAVRANQSRLPAIYRAAYAEPLVNALPDVVVQLRQQFEASTAQGTPVEDAMADTKALADTLVGAVRDWGVEVYRAPLARFEAVVSNMYRSFLSKVQRAHLTLPLIETIPPLVTFASTAAAGPFTITVDSVRQLTGASIGVVSLPGSYAQHPLLWAALAHETGGHDVLHADPGLLEQLAAGVTRAEGVPAGIGGVWAAWMDETASDVYGILNIGPAFAASLAAFFAALEGTRGGPGNAELGTIRAMIPVSNGQLLDPHPVDLLRLHVAMGVVAALDHLAEASRKEWLDVLGAIAHAASGGVNSIDVVDVDRREVIQKLPLSAMASTARDVGRYIATVKLDALGGGRIQDIETWNDMDETAARHIAAAAATTPIATMGDDAQLLAGATMALLAKPGDYQAITARLNAALDESFARDPIFGTLTPQSALALKVRGRMVARTPVSPPFPLRVG